MDFALPPDLLDLQRRTRDFVRDRLARFEHDPRLGEHGPSEDLRRELQAEARAVGLLTPHASKALGGLGLSHVEKAIVFEEAGYSPVGPLALNVFAPDEGNIHLLELVATEAQKQRYLVPLVKGETRSCFAMTEPAPGAGSDPSMLATTATKIDGGYRIDGGKWFITGADGAAFTIVMARLESGEATMFLSPMDAPGIRIERTMASLDRCFPGGHCVVRFEGLEVPDDAVLGEPGKGFQYAQVRLAPARLTHCMRWLGAARRAHDIATEYARTRTSFGKTLGEHQGVGFMLADNEIDLHTTRLAIWHCAWILDNADPFSRTGGHESSLTKVLSAEAVFRVVDRAVQILGGSGVTGETLVERIWRDIRPFRIYDGPSEVHRASVARRILKKKATPA